MKILLLLNKPEREASIMKAIKREVCLMQPSACVEIREMCTPDFIGFVFKYKPNVILTFPFTCEGFSKSYYLFKYFLNTKIITYRAEGVIDFKDADDAELMLGKDQYGLGLVDYEIFWGKKLADAVGRHLLENKRIHSSNGVRVAGYPRLERYFDKSLDQEITLPENIKLKFSEYTKDKIVLFVTGMQIANYTRQNVIDAKDLVLESDPFFKENLEEFLDLVEKGKKFRKFLIENVKKAALENPKALIVLKKHPIEKEEDYATLKNISNILYIHEAIEVQDIIPLIGALFHSGSTTLVDAYLAKIPSVYVYNKNILGLTSTLGWQSSTEAEVNDISNIVKSFLSRKLVFVMSPEIKSTLKELFNIEEHMRYKPSKKIAEMILDPKPIQKIKLTDPYLWNAFISLVIKQQILRVLRTCKTNFINCVHMIKKIR